jgi:outer membrane protein assembly factor BamB
MWTVVANGVVYAGSNDGKLYAFDAAGTTNCSGSPKTCQPLWTAATGGNNPSPAVANGVVYVGADKLYAFDAAGTTNCSGSPKTCQPLWTATLPEADATWAPAVANGVVYVGSDDEFTSSVAAYDAAGTTNCSGSPKTCQPLWTASTGGFGSSASSPVVSHGVVYVSGEGKLYAFGLEKVPPITSVVIPSNGATLSGTTTFDAQASDNVKVSRVEFRLTGGSSNNALIGVANPSPYGWIAQWDTTTVPNGPYTLNSVAYDPANNSGRSANVNITVQN